MTPQIIEVMLSDLTIPSVSDCNDANFVYEHLKRYCSKFRPLPAIEVTLDGDRLVVTGRCQYAAIARDLGDDWIRAALLGFTYEELKRRGVPGLRGLVSRETLERELQEQVVVDCHVFFFDRIPEQAVIEQIDVRFQDFLKQSLSGLMDNDAGVTILSNFDRLGPCYEVCFPTPVEDHSWARRYHDFITSISSDLCPIVTYQGWRFGT